MSIKRAVGIFATREEAQKALMQLRDNNFEMDRVSVIAQDASQYEHMSGANVNNTPDEQAKEGAAAGAIAGTATGGLLGLIGGLGVLAIPGIGAVAEAGIVLANTLLGSGFGAAGGSLAGALIGWGIPEDRANYYDNRVSEGDYLVIVEGSEAEVTTAQTILNNRGIRDWAMYHAPETTPYSRSMMGI
ncbi:MAG: general stress protein [Oscillatoria sp. PMC 1068.18]|nr:general stress protein [Oscillatoria sp. PMC 1076.18]MEC4990483.1 general stress protein [Oscillatoria sp. PMC 1068.18]